MNCWALEGIMPYYIVTENHGKSQKITQKSPITFPDEFHESISDLFNAKMQGSSITAEFRITSFHMKYFAEKKTVHTSPMLLCNEYFPPPTYTAFSIET